MGTRGGVPDRDRDRGCPRNCERRATPGKPLARFGAGKAEWSRDPRARRPAIGILTHSGRGCSGGRDGVTIPARRAVVFPAEPDLEWARQLGAFMLTATALTITHTKLGRASSWERWGSYDMLVVASV